MRASLNTPHDFSMIYRGLLPEFSCCYEESSPSSSSPSSSLLASPERLSGRTAAAGGSGKFTPSTIMSPASSIRPSTEIRLGVLRVHKPTTTSHPRVLCERGPPRSGSILKYKVCTPQLTRGSFTDKENHDYPGTGSE